MCDYCNDMEDYDSKESIICGRQSKDELWFQQGPDYHGSKLPSQTNKSGIHSPGMTFDFQFAIYNVFWMNI